MPLIKCLDSHYYHSRLTFFITRHWSIILMELIIFAYQFTIFRTILIELYSKVSKLYSVINLSDFFSLFPYLAANKSALFNTD